MKLRRRTTLLLLLPLLMLPGCREKHEWRQKITVTVTTPEGEKSGSAVTSVEWWDNTFSGGWGGADKHSALRGEAVVVNLDRSRHLFALLKPGPLAGGESIADLATQVVTGRPGRQWSDKAFEAVRHLPRPTRVPPQFYPLLVTFDDVADPATVRRVDPADLAASFGPGVSLKSVMLEITDEPVTEGRVEGVLGWLGPHPEPALFPVNPRDFSFAAKLRQGNFIMRDK